MQPLKEIYLEIYAKRQKNVFFGQAIVLSLCERIQGVKKNTTVAKMWIFIVRMNWKLFKDNKIVK